MSKNKLYNAATTAGKMEIKYSVIFYLIISISLFIWAYFNNKNWNYNIKTIRGSVQKINTPSGSCNQTISTSNSSNTIIYNCPLTVKYSIDAHTLSTVDIYTTGSVNYRYSDIILLSYDPTSNEKPTLPIFRITTGWIIFAAVVFLICAFAEYSISRNKIGTDGALEIVDKV